MKPINTLRNKQTKLKEEAGNLPNRNPTELNTYWQTTRCSSDIRMGVKQDKA